MGSGGILGDIGSLLGISSPAQREGQRDQTAANNSLSTAAGDYGNLATQGASNTALYNQWLTPLMQNYMQVTGIDSSQLPGGGAAAAAAAGVPRAEGMPDTGANAYGLTTAQQQELNGQVGTINQQKQTALGEYQTLAAAHGVTDPTQMQAGIQHINNTFDTQSSQQQAAFANTAQQQRAQAVQNLLNLTTGVGQAGSGQTQAAAGGTAAIGGQQQQNAQYNTNQANAGAAAGGNLLGYLTQIALPGVLQPNVGGVGAATTASGMPALPAGYGSGGIPGIPVSGNGQPSPGYGGAMP